QLRLDIMCHADDTPRWTSSDHTPASGIGQQRQCRSWIKLENWAEEHTACYHYLNASAQNLNQLERFKFCPESSSYSEKVRKYFESDAI
ncbi:hypothetical protein MMC15_005533, partial [Xylographa vitiligo]|nr:hypothetical protein [Xylographa vitiligo]